MIEWNKLFKKLQKIVRFYPLKNNCLYVTFSLLLNNSTASCQINQLVKHTRPLPFIFIEGNIGYSSGNMSGLGGSIILSNHWGLHMRYHQCNKVSNEVPSDWESGLCIWTCTPPTDELYTYTYGISRGFDTRTQLIRFQLEAGLAFLQYEKVHFTPYISTGWLNLSGNYTKNYSTKHSIGISLRSVAIFPFSQITGLQIATMGVFTPDKSYVGIEASMLLGYIRERLKNRKPK